MKKKKMIKLVRESNFHQRIYDLRVVKIRYEESTVDSFF